MFMRHTVAFSFGVLSDTVRTRFSGAYWWRDGCIEGDAVPR